MISKEPTCSPQSCNTIQLIIFGGYLKVRESFVYMSHYLGQYRSNHIVTRAIVLRYDESCIVYRSTQQQRQKYPQLPIPYQYENKCEILNIITQITSSQNDKNSTLNHHKQFTALRNILTRPKNWCAMHVDCNGLRNLSYNTLST